jgi:hypothetical protein
MSDFSHLIGHRFPGGTYQLPGYLAWLWTDAALATRHADVEHPSLGYFVAMQGAGITIQELFDLMEADADSGVMFGETELEFSGPIRSDVDYAVEGEITGVERKSGKRAGVFDRLTFVIRVLDSDSSTPLVTNTNTWIFPRAEA